MFFIASEKLPKEKLIADDTPDDEVSVIKMLQKQNIKNGKTIAKRNEEILELREKIDSMKSEIGTKNKAIEDARKTGDFVKIKQSIDELTTKYGRNNNT